MKVLDEKVLKGIKELYSKEQYDLQVARYTEILDKFNEKYTGEPIFVSSPGRIEICGNHTDHQHGRVLGAAIDLDTAGAVIKNADSKVIVDSIGYSPVEFDTSDLTLKEDEKGTSIALTKGVLKYLSDKGYKIGGFTALTKSRVFKGAGVSSSASFEVLIGKIVSVLFNDDAITPLELVYAAHFAENVYFGKPCGLLDQSMIAMGGVNYIDFMDPTSPKIETIIPDLSDYGIVLVNTGGDHSDLTGCYADVKNEMREVANFFGKDVLRDVDYSEYVERLPELSRAVSGRAVLRGAHFFSENERVKKGAEALKSGDLNTFFKMLNESGDSSYKLLQNCYVASDTAERIPLALLLANFVDGVVAKRVHGGGFAGTVLIVVKKEAIANLTKKAIATFGEENVYCLSIRNKGAVRF